MEYKLLGLNLVVLFSEPGKHSINLNELINMFPVETPFVFWQPDPISPGTIKYQQKPVEITVINNHYQISSAAINNSIPTYFGEILSKALKASEGRKINAFGFNFDFSCPNLEEIKDLFDIKIATKNFTYLPQSSIRFTFKKNNLTLIFELTDRKPDSFLHINVHHEEPYLPKDLSEKIQEKLNIDFKTAEELIKEVLVNA
ncbi:MAG: hypothetical protein L5655_09365 [Thermosediminibacteraceae bacterium]|nr:hypothetical protein [Thermosediminibacteraceae bacterium]